MTDCNLLANNQSKNICVLNGEDDSIAYEYDGKSSTTEIDDEVNQSVNTANIKFVDCKKQFTTNSDLRYRRCTTTLSVHKCGECGIQFALKSNLTRHEKIHGGDRFGMANSFRIKRSLTITKSYTKARKTILVGVVK